MSVGGTLQLLASPLNVAFKFISLRPNIKLYNKLSKKVGDFKDSEDEYIYT